MSHVDVLKIIGRKINLTISDGNCLFRSLSKGLIGTEKYHYHPRSMILGFIYVKSEIFLPHIEQKQQCNIGIREYCDVMGCDGVWGTDIELLATATMLRAPVYTYTTVSNASEYRWLRYAPLAKPDKLSCDYVPSIRRLLYMSKPVNYHLELFHFKSNHYDLQMEVCLTILLCLVSLVTLYVNSFALY